MKTSIAKNGRMVNSLVDFLTKNTIKCDLQVKYDKKKGRDVYSTGRDFKVAEKTVDDLIEICQILQLDLNKSNIKSSTGYVVKFWE
jgi:hypothetical protein